MKALKDLVNKDRDNIIKHTCGLISIESTGAEEKPGKPFGDGVDKALKYVLDLAESMGFETVNADGFAGHADLGSSEKSFSEAVKKAVEQLISAGEKIHFFEVVEQRGAVRDNKFKEYQVKLKVAVEVPEPKPKQSPKTEHVCPTCMESTGEHGHLCVPGSHHDEKCEWCGALIPDERHLCNDKVKELSYICNSCGRTAVSAEYLCNPKKIK